ncbi:MAG TPA: HAD hydrolase-like protein [Paenibacillus sp.]
MSSVLGIPGTDSLRELGIHDINKANERWNYFMKDFYHSIEVFSGIFDLISTLKRRHINRGIVTSKTTQELHHVNQLA